MGNFFDDLEPEGLQQQSRPSAIPIPQTPEEAAKWQRTLMLAEGKQGVAAEDERLYYYHLSKKGFGFSPEDRRKIWLQVTGA